MFHHAAKLRSVVAALCVVIACLFCAQSVLVSLDRIEHALDMDHHAHPLAGTIQCTEQGAHECGSNGVHPISHAHHGDTATTVLAASAATGVPVHPQRLTVTFVHDFAGPGIGPLLPERPPKT